VQLGFETSTRGDATVLSLRGDLDLATAPAFRTEVARALSGGASTVVLDLAALDFLDSVGLGLIVAALKRARSHGASFAVVCDEPRVLKPFELTELTRVIVVEPTIDAALERLGR
jgi:anti-sigma B factor antagonist